LLFSGKKRPRYVREIMRESDLALRTVQDELKRLRAMGLVSSHSNGYHRFFAPNNAHPLFHELTRIAEMSERLPHTKSSELFRASRTRRKKKRFKPAARRRNRKPNSSIFAKRRSKL
jgi:predicted transcriptional regulator